MKQLNITRILLALLFSITGLDVAAHDIEMANDDGVTIYFLLTNNSKELTVTYRGTSYSNYSIEYSGNVVIPDSVTYRGMAYPVTSIGESAFRDCSGLTSVTIPSSVTSIDSYAFSDCSGLTSVTIPNSVTSIGENAFRLCSGLTNVTIPNSVTSIGENAFRLCTGLNSVTIPNSVTSISNYAFYGCDGLSSVTIPNSVLSIGNYAFYACTGLNSVTIPNSVTSIGESAFRVCSKLESVTMGTGVQRIGSDVFYSHQPAKVIWLTNTPPTGYSYAAGTVNFVPNDKYNLSNKTVYPYLNNIFEVNGVKYVPVDLSQRICDAFDCVYDNNAENIIIGETVSYKGVQMTVRKLHKYAIYGNEYVKSAEIFLDADIEDYVFYNCKNMATAEIGEGVTAIGGRAFYGCSSLQEIGIPKTAESVGDYAFSNCTSLEKVMIADRETTLTLGSNGSSPLFYSCPLDSVYIGGDISYDISNGYSPFYNNASLRAVMITDKETEITQKEFSFCSNLEHLSFGSSVTSIGENALKGCVSVNKIVSKAKTPPTCASNVFDDINKWDCKLYVPTGSKSSYQGADQWSDFFFVEELENEGDDPGQGDEVDQTFVFIDEQGNVVTDGAVITVNSINAEGQMVIPLKVRNVEGYATAVSMYETIDALPNGVWQTCAFGNSVMLNETGYSAKNIVSGTEDIDISTIWTPEEGQYATWTATLQIHIFNITQQTVFGQTIDKAGNEIIGYGPKVTINFVYTDESVITPSEKCATPTIAFANGKLQFSCETEGIEFVPSISLVDAENTNEVNLFSVYRFSVYAKKDGYLDSDVATMNIDFNRLNGDMNHDGQISIADATAIVNIILNDITVIDPEPKFYYSVGTENVTRSNYTTVNNAQYKLELSEVPDELDLSVINLQQACILLPDGCMPIIRNAQGIVATTSVSLGIGYTVYTTTSAINGAECTCTVIK